MQTIRDYKNIDTTTHAGIIMILKRKIMFWQFTSSDYPLIYRYQDQIPMDPRRKTYFTYFFWKYARDFNR